MRLALALLSVTTVSIAVLAAGCGGKKSSGGPTPTPGPSPTPTVTAPPGATVESEPNDIVAGDPADVIPAGSGTKQFFGVCADASDVDGYSMVVGSGLVSAEITWTESAANDDLDLAVYDSSGVISGADQTVPPNDSPADVSLVITTVGGASVTTFVEVDCLNTTPNVAYFGSVTIP